MHLDHEARAVCLNLAGMVKHSNADVMMCSSAPAHASTTYNWGTMCTKTDHHNAAQCTPMMTAATQAWEAEKWITEILNALQ